MDQAAAPPPPDETPVRSDDRAARLLWGALTALMLLGTVLRVREWAFNRSLWLDESWLALNLLDRGFLGMLRPLDNLQTGPLLFLWATEAMCRVVGPWEWSLRLPSLIAGLAALPLVALVARRLLREPTALLAVVALTAVSPQLVFYSSELKPYALDVSAGALLTWLGLRVLASLGTRAFRRRLIEQAAAGVVIVFASSPSVFVIAGVGVVLMARAATARRWREVAAVAAASAVTAAAFGVHYGLVLRHAAAETEFYHNWGKSFAAVAPKGRVAWVLDNTIRFLAEGLWLRHYGPVLLLLVAGFVWLAARRPWALAVAFAPVLVTYAASRAGLYPIGPRVIMYLAPVVLVTVGGGVEVAVAIVRGLGTLARRPTLGRRAGHLAGGVAALLIVIPPARLAAQNFAAPPGREEIRPLLEQIAAERTAGQAVWMSQPAAKPYEYYARTRPRLALDAAAGPALVSDLKRPTAEEVVAEVEALAGDGDVWLLYSHRRNKPVEREAAQLLAATRAAGQMSKTPGARLYRFGPPTR